MDLVLRDKCPCCQISNHADPVAVLTASTHFTRREIKMIYQNFKQSCPDGNLDVDVVKDVLLRFFPCGNTSPYAQHVFRTMDTTQRGKVCFKSFLKWMSMVSRGSEAEKLRWIFDLYDVDSDGIISKSDLSNIIKSIYLILGRRSELVADQKYLNEKTDAFFDRFDLDGDGFLSLEEFVTICSQDEQVTSSLAHFRTVI